MQICIFGAGSIGGLVAARLCLTGNDVSVLARGAHLESIRTHGLRLAAGGSTEVAQVRASDDARALGPQDVVLVAVKACSMASVAAGIAPLLKPGTLVVFATNGIPWWYARDHQPAAYAAPLPDLSFLDPEGGLASVLQGARVVGGVVYAAAAVSDPGTVTNSTPGGNRLILGQPDGQVSPEVQALAERLRGAGFDSPVMDDIRSAVWRKLVYNLCQNSICGLVGQPLHVLGRNPALLGLAKTVMGEGLAVARAHGVALDMDPETAFGPRQTESSHKPSMLQDLEQGRPAEIDAILVAVQAFARSAGVPVPHLDTIAALLTQRAIDAGSYPANIVQGG